MVLGLDGAGEIVEADPGSGLRPGQRVITNEGYDFSRHQEHTS
jgi:NADPH:quinone reductase-like Zn-dependent oxidoreductase